MKKKDAECKDIPNLARNWLNSGKFISWTSTLNENRSFGKLDVFTTQKGGQ